MNTKILIIILCLIAFGTSGLLFPAGVGAVFIAGVLAAMVFVAINMETDDNDFILKVFCGGLILRLLFALMLYTFSLQEFFGPDALYYDWLGWVLSSYWNGDIGSSYSEIPAITDVRRSGWGMSYFVGSIYYVVGQNPLAVQFFCAVLGAATAPIVYLCSKEIFSNKRVARVSAVIVALCPSLIIWSSQGLKDGIIVFFLVLSILCVLRLQKRFNYMSFLVLMLCLMGILSLRFYIFYLLVVATVGSFAIGDTMSPASLLRRGVLILMVAAAVGSFAGGGSDLDKFTLEKLHATREDLARGNAGFGRDLDVSTTSGALAALPIGFTYLMLAPFPWQLTNLRQAITLPEMILWWSSLPFLVIGLWYTFKHRLRTSIAVLLFTFMLTLSYSLYLGNIGTAYRQRAQIQIFHFIFIAVGWTLWREKQENKKLLKNVKQRNALKSIRDRHASNQSAAAAELKESGGGGGGLKLVIPSATTTDSK